MRMNTVLKSGLIALAVLISESGVWAGSATPNSIMVIPARQRMVQLAFELSRFKEIGVVTYNNNPTLAAPLIHAWNGQEWVQVSMDDYVEGRFMSGDPKHVFLLGDATSLPLKMQEGPSWYKDLHRITTLDIANIVNEVGNTLRFSARQWKWIAEKYGMQIEDQNTERRRYGRWGAPGKEKDLNPTKMENIVLPPAAPVAEPIVEPKQVPKTKVEEPKAKIEAVTSEMPMPPKATAPVAEKQAVPVNVTVTAEPAKVAAPAAVEAPEGSAPVEPVKVEASATEKVTDPVK